MYLASWVAKFTYKYGWHLLFDQKVHKQKLQRGYMNMFDSTITTEVAVNVCGVYHAMYLEMVVWNV